MLRVVILWWLTRLSGGRFGKVAYVPAADGKLTPKFVLNRRQPAR